MCNELIFDDKPKTFENFVVDVSDLSGSLLLLDSETGLSKTSHQSSCVFETLGHVFKGSAIGGEGGFVPGEGGHGVQGRVGPELRRCRFDTTLRLLSG